MLSVIVPIYNEEENIIQFSNCLLEVLKMNNYDYEILFVNDGSQDQTSLLLKNILSKEKTKIKIIEFRRNFGQTAALLAGFQHAKGELIITMDGDGQNNPRDIPKFLAALTSDYDVICGWRKNRHDSLSKKIPSKINNYLNRRLNKLSIHDSGCTFRLYRREAVENIQLFAEGHRYIPATLTHQGFQIGEIITNHLPRTKGKSKYGLSRLFRGFIDLLTLSLYNKWVHKPMHLFIRWSIFFSAIGCISFLWMFLERFAFPLFWSFYPDIILLRENPLLFIGLIFCLFSILLPFMGFLAELITRKIISKDSYLIKHIWE